MSYQIGIGVPVDTLLPVTGVSTLPFTGHLTFLANRIVYHRLKNEKYMGDRLADSSDPHTDPLPHEPRSRQLPQERAARIHLRRRC
ncbi:hypothetical protein W97_04415 [Coniosporium apollinis CBS 100218]|uniref:Uncharacterized protein n=1 Tax=Coniosporium apollinis (strain CBS 100218) TaxID=1168221 RepID=R7YTL4_CONA1|nr:uncharacterized protein W97_04415 [Coniosporium apollinis CBS 100218]EON65178.1 hypothetical protein W97_04415 [Coniosporium apollinis CBS 100218]